MQVYWVKFYAAKSRTMSDGIGPFTTREIAQWHADNEVFRVACIPESERDCGMDWAVRYTISKTYWPNRLAHTLRE